MIRNLMFDLGGIILPLNREEAFRRFREFGIDTERYMGIYGQREFFRDMEAGDISVEDFLSQLAAATGRETVTYEEAAWLWQGYCMPVPVGRLHTLQHLRKKYHVCLLSNTSPFVMDLMESPSFSEEGQPLSHYFDTVFVSYRMHAYKPDPQIFLQALQSDDMRADETLFIDDSQRNIAAAEALGIHGLWVETNEEWEEKLSLVLSEE